MDDLTESNEDFAYIAGYTKNGFPFGITWEEVEELDIIDEFKNNNEENDILF